MHPARLVDAAVARLGDEAARFDKGRGGYRSSAEIRARGRRVATIQWGGQNPDPHIVGTGGDAPAVAEFLRSLDASHGVSRADVAVDSPGAYDDWCAVLRAWAVLGDVALREVRDPERPEKGSTLYVGSSKSESMMRVYEKGKQMPELGRPDLARVEVEYKPQKGRKAWAATASAVEVFGASRLSRRFRDEVLGVVAEGPPARSARVSDLEGALRAMTAQYGARLLELLEAWEGDMGAAFHELVLRTENGGVMPGAVGGDS